MSPLAAKFLETAGSGFAQKLVDRLLSPALAFWLGGLLAYLDDGRVDVLRQIEQLTQLQLAALALASLFLIAGTAALAELLEFRTLRLIEGYWPRVLSPVRKRRTECIRKHLDNVETRWEDLGKRFHELTPEEITEYAALDRERARYPRDPKLIMPTRVGNLLRAAETYSQRRYGLAASLFWPRMWLMIPKEERDEVTKAHSIVMQRVRVFVLSVGFCSFVAWAWWVPIVGLGAAFATYLSLLAACVPFGDQIRSVFDLHHRDLVKTITGKELSSEHPMAKGTGEALTQFIYRGDRKRLTRLLEGLQG